MGLTSLSHSLPSHCAGHGHAASDFILLEVYDSKATDPSKPIFTDLRATFHMLSGSFQLQQISATKKFLDTVRAAFPYDPTQTGRAGGSKFTTISFRQTSDDGKEWEQAVQSGGVNINTRFSFKAPAGVQSVE